jgi:putative ABC transport system permease protein
MVIWDKVWVDLWGNKIRTILAVLSIAAGVFAIGAVFGMVDQLISSMDEAHQAVFPSHINMSLVDGIDRHIADSLEKLDGVEGVEVLNSVTIRYKLNPQDEWERGEMVMRDDYEDQKYDVVQLKEGKWPAKNRIAIERQASQYYGIEVGDEIIFELEKTERPLRVTGKIRHPFVGPPEFGAPAFFFASAEGMERFGVEEGTFSQLLVQIKPYSSEFAKEVASEIKDHLAKENVSVAATYYQDPGEHWGRIFVEGATLVMQILAVVSLFASVILILNTLTALITQQTNQIGIIKAIGGSTTTILKTYLAEVLVYGLLALLISLPLGVFVAFGFTQWFLNIFNIDYEVFQFSNRAIIYQVIAALIAPLIAALWPVLKGASITVREAIASYGLSNGGFGFSWFDRAVERIGQRFLPSHYAVALGNMFRRKGRLTLTQLVLVTAGAMFLIIMSLSASITLTLDGEFERRSYDVTIRFDDEERVDRAVALAQSLDGVEEAEVWFNHPASILRQGQRTKEAGVGAEINGVPIGSDMYKPLIVAGRWLQPGDDRVIVMNGETADDNHIKVGDMVTLDLGELGDDNWQVVGLYQAIVLGYGFSNDAIYAPQQAVFKVTRKYNKASLLFARTRFHSENYVDAVANQLKDWYEARNVDVDSSQAIYKERQEADSQFGATMNTLLALAVIVALVGGIGLMGSLSISVVERTREIGVMRAIGAGSARLMSMFVMEGVLQGLFSWVLAMPISLVLARPMANALGQTMFGADLDFAYNHEAVITWLVIVLTISTLASILPARNATVISVRESLAYE